MDPRPRGLTGGLAIERANAIMSKTNYSGLTHGVCIDENADGTYTAWIETESFDGTLEECRRWLAIEDPDAPNVIQSIAIPRRDTLEDGPVG